LIALLGVSLFILGCDDSSDDSTQAAENAAKELSEKTDFNGKVDVTDATVTVKASTAITITEAFTVGGGVTLVVPATATLTVPAGKPATIDGTLIIGAGAEKVTVTKATLKGGAADGDAGTLTLANNDELTLSSSGTIVVATTGTGGVILENTEFGAGTYTATGTIAIKAGTTGDTITTGATAGSKLGLGTLSLGNNSATAAVYTFKGNNAGDAKVALATDSITIPADSGTTAGASVDADGKAGITLGDGSIVIGGKGTSSAGSGHLDLAVGTTIGVFGETTKTTISDGAGFADGDDQAKEDITSANITNTGGTIAIGTAVKIYCGNDVTANTATSSITTTLAFE
jgi:hypothetical protein